MLALVLPDEQIDDASARRIATDPVLVPSIFPIELANALYQAERRGRIPAAITPQLLRDVADFQFTTSAPLFDLAEELELARKHGLTIYDACYLALAKRTVDPILASCDARLRAAALAESIPVTPR